MLKFTLFVVASLGLVSLASQSPLKSPNTLASSIFFESVNPAIDYGNANLYVDLVLFNINRQLPDQVPIGDLGGTYKLTDCIFYGTEYGLRREGDATLITTGNIVQFAAQFGMQDVGISCVWHQVGLSGQGGGTTAAVHISSAFGIKLDHGQHPWLTEFRVIDMDPIITDIHGLTPAFNWLAEDIANYILDKAQDEIILVVETTVRDIVQLIMDTMVIP